MKIFDDFYRDKRVLVTGHGGFKGSWLAFWLTKLGATVAGYSLLAESEERMHSILKLETLLDTNVIADICDTKKLQDTFTNFQPEIVIHMAAQPFVRLSYSNPVQTYQSNVMGTLNVLEAARQTSSVKVFINITTDKCYENKELDYKYQEDDNLGGYDMYSSSKACAEILTSSYRRSFLQDNKPFALTSVRAGNVIGGGDWGEDRLIPDCIKSFHKGESVCIRNPLAIRPWQHVLEPLAGYLLLGQKIFNDPHSYAQAYNFGPDDIDGVHILKVSEVAQLVAENWNKHRNEHDSIAVVTVGKNDGLHEAGLLQLDIRKAQKELGFLPVWDANKTIAKTTQWYHTFYNTQTDMIAFTEKQILEFVSDAHAKCATWSK